MAKNKRKEVFTMTYTVKQAHVNAFTVTIQAEKDHGYTVLLTETLSWYAVLHDKKTYGTKEKALARFYALCRKYR